MVKSVVKHWWKILGVLILLYSFSAGFLVPLKPGVLSVAPYTVKTGQTVDLTITGYNTQFTHPDIEGVDAFLKIDSSHILKASSVTIQDRKQLSATFNLPDQLPNNQYLKRATFILFDKVNGYMVSPASVTIEQREGATPVANQVGWNDEINLVDVSWTFAFPFRGILYETIRNTFFHVAVWFAMFILLIVSLIYSLKYLRSRSLQHDAVAAAYTQVAIGLGLIGLATGSVWAKSAWGAYWTNDPKLNMSVVSLMIYIAYAILRSSFTADDRRAQVSAAYNIFAFCAMIPLIFIVPRLTSSLHPGNGGNPAFGGEDLDSTLRMVFYPSIIGLTLIGTWIASLLYRVRKVELHNIERELR